MVEAGWATPTTLHLAGAFNLAGYILGASTALASARLMGVRPAIALAAALAVFAFAASAVPLPAPAFIALRALSGATGGILMIVIPPVVANVVAPSHRGRANGLAFAGVGTGFVLSGTAVPAFAAAGPPPPLAGAGDGAGGRQRRDDGAAAALGPAGGGGARRALPGLAARAGLPRPRRSLWRGRGGLCAAHAVLRRPRRPRSRLRPRHRRLDLGRGRHHGRPRADGRGRRRRPLRLRAGAQDHRGADGDRGGASRAHPQSRAADAVGDDGGRIDDRLGSSTSGRTREIVGPEAHTAAWALQTVAFAIIQAGAATASPPCWPPRAATPWSLRWRGHYRGGARDRTRNRTAWRPAPPPDSRADMQKGDCGRPCKGLVPEDRPDFSVDQAASAVFAWTGPESLPLASTSRSTNSMTAIGALSP